MRTLAWTGGVICAGLTNGEDLCRGGSSAALGAEEAINQEINMQATTLRAVERAGADAVSDTRHSDLAVIAARVLFAYAIHQGHMVTQVQRDEVRKALVDFALPRVADDLLGPP